jgi:GxxExxY protein
MPQCFRRRKSATKNTKDTKEKFMALPSGLITEKILECALRVHAALGIGFLEKVYENALVHELRKNGLSVVQQCPIPVRYDGVIVGDYVADLSVESKILLELKAICAFADEHAAICINYLRSTSLPVCLLLNFGSVRLGIKRLVGDSYINEPHPL